ncbi:ImpA family type VI secretion system protein [Sphingomonas sp. Y38-1Y]|uniref:type VI secretion system protein TssA n=1 Tax=Sphingomonas sp. Y38-1Y TaxID=3078265 RepID=UPI0028E8EB9F|nr:type VI secretion system ImpA family N-terminal domain-containing protein [Sphingomonas sp. Y38-1Y]
MDVEQLLAPVSADDRVGPDLAYDNDRQLIEAAFDQAAEGGDAAEGVDWRDTLRRSEAQLARTKDLWLASYIVRAGARLGDLNAVRDGTRVMAGLFEGYWDDVHPQLDEYGFPGRKAPCESLTRIGEFLGPLRRTVLIEHPRLGRYTGEDIERFAVEGDAAEGYGMFRRAVEELDTAVIAEAVDALDQIRESIRAADRVLTEHAGSDDTGTNFQPTYDAIEALRRAILPYAGVLADPVAASEESADWYADIGDDWSTPTPSAAEPSGGGKAGGRVDNRDDVIRSIDAIIDYYSRRESSSPIPVALRRIRAWVPMDFLELMKDIAPSGESEASIVLKQREDSGWG